MSETLTVADLITRLMQLPDQDMTVELDGCDCSGPCTGMVIEPVAYEGPEVLLLTREGGLWQQGQGDDDD